MKRILVALALLALASPARAQTAAAYTLIDSASVSYQMGVWQLSGKTYPISVSSDSAGKPLSPAIGTSNPNGTALAVQGVTGGVPVPMTCSSGCAGLSVAFSGAIGANGTPVGFKDGSGNFQALLGDTTNGQWVNVKASISLPVTGTFFQATQPISAASLPLPTGAATQTTLASILTALGSPFQAGASIANTSFGISGTLPAFAATPTFNLGTLNGAATAANQTLSFGPVGAGTAASNSNLAGGVFNSTPITVANTQQAALQVDANGFLKVNVAAGGASGGTSSTFGAAFPATGTAAGMSQGGNMVALTGTSGNLNVQCANCSGSGASAADEAAFTAGSSVFAPSGGFFQTTATNNALTTGQQGLVQMTAQRAFFVNPRNSSGTEIGTSGAPFRIDPTGTTTQPVSLTSTTITGTVAVTQSGTWTVQPGNTANTTAWLVTGTGGTFPATQSGTWNITNISGTVSLPTGAATSANQPTNAAIASTTAGQTGHLVMGAVTTGAPSYTTAQTDPLSLTTAGALRVDGSAVTQPVSLTSTTITGNVTVAQATAANLNATVVGTGTFAVQAAQSGNWTARVVGNAGAIFDAPTGSAVPANALYVGMNQGGNMTGLTGTSGNLNVQCANCSGSGVSTADEATFTAGTSLFAGSGGFFQTTATNNPLTNGQQGMFQTTANRALFINLRNASGTEIGTSATPVQVSLANTAANGTAVLVTGTGGTFPITAASLPLPTGAATSANQPSNAAIGSTTSGQTGNLSMGAVTTAAPTYTTAQTNPLSLTTAGALRVDGSAVTQPVSIASAVTVAQATAANLNATVVGTGTFAVQATLQASATTAIGKVDPNTIGNWGLQVSTQNSATPTNGMLMLGQFNTSPTTITSGNVSPFQLDNGGRLIVNCASGCGGSGGTSIADEATFTQGTTSLTPIGGIFVTAVTNLTAGQAGAVRLTNDRKMMVDTPNVEVAVGGAAAPTNAVLGGGVFNSSPITVTNTQAAALQIDASGFLKVNVSAGTVAATQSGTWNITNISGTVSLPTGASTSALQPTNAAQASTTSGQTGLLMQGAVTTSNPSYTTAQTDPLSLDTNGGLRIAGEGTAGTATGGVMTVQGVASMTPLLTNPGTAANWGIGATGSAVPANAVYLGITSGGNLTGWTGAVTQATAANLNATVVGTGTFAVQLTGATNNINNIAGTVSLPTGAATSANQPTNAAQGSTTSGQTGILMQGAVTTAAPSYTTAQTSPLSLDTAGNIRVNCTTGCSSSGGSSLTDEGTFTQGTTAFTVAGGFYSTAPALLTSGQGGAAQVTADRFLKTNAGLTTSTLTAWNSSTGSNTTQNLMVNGNTGVPAILMQLDQTTTITGGAITIEGTYDGSNWVTVPTAQVLNPNTFAALTNPYTLVASTNQPFLILVQGYQQVRIRLSTVITGTGAVTPNITLLPSMPIAPVIAQPSTNVIGFTSNDPCSQGTKLGASINLTASGQVITGTASKKTYICSIDIVSATAQNIALVEGTGTTCATNIFGLAGGTTAATGWNLAANGGLTKGSGAGTVYSPSADTNGTAANQCLLLSGTGQTSGQISYVQQ